MSGPIIRKYGFPNHEEIFGKKEIEHGVEEGSSGDDVANAPVKAEEGTKKKAAGKKSKKSTE